MNEKLLRLEALAMIQTIDSFLLSNRLNLIAKALQDLLPNLPPQAVLDAAFSRQRNRLLQDRLEAMEKTNPELAAQLQQLIDQSCTNEPFDYE